MSESSHHSHRSNHSHHPQGHKKSPRRIHLSRGKKLEQKNIPRVAAVCVAVLLVVVLLIFLLRKLDEKRLTVVLPEEDETQVSSTDEAIHQITVDGVIYQPKTDEGR